MYGDRDFSENNKVIVEEMELQNLCVLVTSHNRKEA
jgi:hypothetical protein